MSLRKLDQTINLTRDEIRGIVSRTPAYDIHTHLYDPAMGSLLLWGIDELLTYHYLIAESARFNPGSTDHFWKLSKSGQAEVIWQSLFDRTTPLSEASRGIVTTLNALGLDVRRNDLLSLRKWFADQDPILHVDRCLELANVRRVCMTNSPFDPNETSYWKKGFQRDSRFVSGLRMDELILSWNQARGVMALQGYATGEEVNTTTAESVTRFLEDWTSRLDAQYLMVSLPPDFTYPESTVCSQLLERVVLPFCASRNLPLALMMGVKRAVNPALRLAGDGVGRANLTALQNLLAGHPSNRFLATVLARENQHEFAVLARKFSNLHPFGCWWFTNIPVCISEITRMRLELLGTSFTYQHSDARVVDQLIYKWSHSRQILGDLLADKYHALAQAGWQATEAEVARDATSLLGGSFETFLS